MPHHLARLSAACLLTGCGPGNEASFSLRLEPVTAPNQADAFQDVVSLWVEVRAPNGGVDRYELGAPDSGSTSEVGGLMPIDPGSVVAVEGYDVESRVASHLVLYGVTAPLDVGPDEDVVVPIYTAGTERVALFDEMEDGLWCAAGASDGAGAFYLFGGSDYGMNGGSASDRVLSLALAPVQAGFPLETVATLPPTSDDWGSDGVSSITGRSCATATRIGGTGHGDVGRILVTGGWSAYLNGWSVTSQVLIFDPATGTLEVAGSLRAPRAAHVAVALDGGEVVLFGGFTHSDATDSATFTSTVEVYQPATRTFARGSDRFDIEIQWGAAASSGDAAIWCGGLDYGATRYAAHDACYRVDGSGTVSEISAPSFGTDTGILRPAMASLGDGRVLLCGGSLVTGEVEAEDTQPATDRAWIYDAAADVWTRAASMNQPRAFHAAAPLTGGRVLVVGGFDGLSDRGMQAGQPVACAEVYDPETDVWSDVGDCSGDGSTGVLPEGFGDPTWAVDPEYGGLFFGGLDRNLFGASHVVLYTPNPR
ncbi:MAG: hypothetical protein JXB39_03185 [Deltaproteobacteria bacterium]|nr:hypothetical protein [Deltaproteobacteria bacterium]